jgi:hypothetical protein
MSSRRKSRKSIWILGGAMQRMLVWPWHGQVKNGLIHLPNGATKAYTQPPNSQRALNAVGDTHLIIVPNIAAISEEEQALAPPGGQYWAGRALITSSQLYNQPVDGWIYQALDGTRWKVGLLQRTIGDTSTSLQFSISRFGAFGVAPDVRRRTVTVPLGRLPAEDRAKFFADLGSVNAVSVQIHSVSTSGRNAVLAWSAFNTTSGTDTDTDLRMRPYSFAQVTLTGSGVTLGVTVSVLYGSDEVMHFKQEVLGGAQNQYAVMGAGSETDREPIFDQQGTQIGDKVTYNFPSSVGVQEGPGWQGPTSSSTVIKWLVMLPFEGEEPSPCYLDFTDSWSIGGASFSVVTIEPRIANEYNDGSIDIVQPGSYSVSGGCVAAGNATIKWDGPGENWAQGVTYGSSSSIDGSVLTQGRSVDDMHESESFSNSGFRSAPPIGGFLDGSAIGRVPEFGAVVGTLLKLWYFSIYSNNLIAVSHQFNQEPAVFDGVLTPGGYLPTSGSYPVDDVRHYGSFNPATQEFVVGSTSPVNWI